MSRRRRDTTDRRYKGRFGGELQRLIDEKGVSHRWLADRIEKNHSTVSGWARGRTLPASAEDFDRIARWLNADADRLRELADEDEAAFLAAKMPTGADRVSVESVRRALLNLGRMSEEEVRDLVDRLRRERDSADALSSGTASGAVTEEPTD